MVKTTGDYTYKKYTWPGGSMTIKENMTSFLNNYKKKPEKCRDIVKKHALNIQANAANNAPVDTGALKNSIETVPTESPDNMRIQDGVEYGVYTELGTSKTPAKHYLGNAAEKEADSFFEDIRKELSE